MTRAECERKLIALAEEADATYRQYNPNGYGVRISTSRDGYISVGDLDCDNEGHIFTWSLEAARNEKGEVYSLNYDVMTTDDPGMDERC